MPTVWFIRHGESQSNAGEPTYSPYSTGLTAPGMRQAECIARAFPKPPALIITSKYPRTFQTAQPTRKRFPDVKYEQWGDVHEFTYLSNVHSVSMTMQERRPGVVRFWTCNDPTSCDGDGAESFIQFISRVSGALERLRYSNADFIAVFTHGYFMRAVWWLLHTEPSKIDSVGMREFRGLLKTLPFPNGVILPVQLQKKEKAYIASSMLSHLSQAENTRDEAALNPVPVPITPFLPELYASSRT